MVALAISSILVAAAVVISFQLGSTRLSYNRPPLLCAANGMALSGSDLWVSGCVFRTRSEFSARIPAIVELDIKTGSLIRVIKDPRAGNDGPVGIAVSGGRVWVANGDGNSILELSAATGMKIRLITSMSDELNSPWNIAASRSDVWIFNGGSFTITELNANDGSLVRVIVAHADELAGVDSISLSGSRLWLTNGTYADNSVVELNTKSGSLVRILNATSDSFNEPAGVAFEGSKVWVTSNEGPIAKTPQADAAPNSPGGSVTVLNATSGSVIRVIKARADHFYGPSGMVVSGRRVWVANGMDDVVTELRTSNGSLVRLIDAKQDGLQGPSEIVAKGQRVWILDSAVSLGNDVWGGAITELNAKHGTLVRVIR